MGKKKDVRYLLQIRETDASETVRQRKRLTEQGCLVITVIEGNLEMEKGLQDIIRNHLRPENSTLFIP